MFVLRFFGCKKSLKFEGRIGFRDKDFCSLEAANQKNFIEKMLRKCLQNFHKNKYGVFSEVAER